MKKKILVGLGLIIFGGLVLGGCGANPGAQLSKEKPLDYQALGECFNNEYRTEFETQYSQEKKEDVIIGIRLSNTSQEKLEEKIVKQSDKEALSGIADLKCLTYLNLNGVQVGNSRDINISPLAGLTNLEYLNLEHTAISDITPLAGLKNLNWLNLKYDQPIRDYSSLKNLKKLKYLNLSVSNKRDISFLANLAQLEELDMRYSNLTNDDMKILGGITSLKKLILGSSDCKITDISNLAGLKNLEELNLADCNLSSLEPLKKLTKIKDLNISSIGDNVKNTEEYISVLREMPSLERVNIGWPEKGIRDQFRAALPKVNFYYN